MWYDVANGFKVNPQFKGGAHMCERDMEKNVDYRKMYYAMAAEVENAIALLIRVQQNAKIYCWKMQRKNRDRVWIDKFEHVERIQKNK